MNNLILADASGNELRVLLHSGYDFEIGDDENSFQVNILRSEYEQIADGSRIYIPGTEFGGLFKRLETNTQEKRISPGGITWRGMLQNKIISPPTGQDYATDSGDINTIIKTRVEAALPGLFSGVNDLAGVTVSNYRYNRYVTLYEGLKSMLKSVGYKLRIEYDQLSKKVIVQASEIEDYSDQIEYSSDMRTNYFMTMDGTGVNHLICLGQGELRNRTVVHLYVDADGNISQTQTFTGINEICAVYDYAGAGVDDLIQSGTEQLKNMRSINTFSINLDFTDTELMIGDIIGGRDYLSGMRMSAPVTGKIARWSNGFTKLEYKLSNDVIVTLEE